ncbi:MAG TPA: hypothetical protein VH302_15675 [Bryobacteraceae bacterium]|jgi:hypothetical protein|nr:hypothetical protein [Bryobacteraceae bacterium]
MFGSQILDVAVGLVLLFLLLSLICSSLKEGLESFTHYRAKDLKNGLSEIFNDPSMLTKFYDHPLIYGLFQGKYNPDSHFNLPSYIPSRTFALAVMDMYKQEPDNATLKRILKPLIQTTADETTRVQTNLEDWFNSSMDRVSGWYKRRTQYVIASFGILIAFGFNVDAIAIARYLNVTPAGRAALVEQATKYSKASAPPESPQARLDAISNAIDVSDIPVGWKTSQSDIDQKVAWRQSPQGAAGWLMKFAGLFATTLAVSLGAPFWFDVLNKFMVIRSTVKPEEKSKDEPSKS